MLTVDEAASDAWQAGIATSLWLAMVTRSPAAQGFVDAISHATAERHLQVYSADPEDEALLEELGASGRVEMPENPLAVSWSGFVGSRTGYFAEKAIEYRAVVNEDGTADVTIAVTLMNNAPLEPESILLGTEADSFDVGEYAAAASVYLPSEATRIRSKVDGGGSLVKLFEREFDRRVVLTVLVAKSGHATTAEISYRMPVQLGVFELGIVPQPELRPTPVTVEITFPEGVRFADISPNLAAEGGALHYDGVPRIPLTLWARTLG
jgi:hypothetical protein